MNNGLFALPCSRGLMNGKLHMIIGGPFLGRGSIVYEMGIRAQFFRGAVL